MLILGVREGEEVPVAGPSNQVRAIAGLSTRVRPATPKDRPVAGPSKLGKVNDGVKIGCRI